MAEPTDLDMALSQFTGDISQYESLLPASDRITIRNQVQRIYAEFVSSSQEQAKIDHPDDEPPSEEALSEHAMTIALEAVFLAGYELGQSDASPEEGLTITLDNATTAMLVKHALSTFTKEE